MPAGLVLLKSAEDKWYFPARRQCSFLRLPTLSPPSPPQPRQQICQKARGTEPMQQCCPSLDRQAQCPEPKACIPCFSGETAKPQRHRQSHGQWPRFPWLGRTARNPGSFGKGKQFLMQEGGRVSPQATLLEKKKKKEKGKKKRKKKEKQGYKGEEAWQGAGDEDQEGYPVLRVPLKAPRLLPGWGQAEHPQAAASTGCGLRACPVLQSAAGVTCQNLFPHIPWEKRGTGRMPGNQTDQERGMVSKNSNFFFLPSCTIGFPTCLLDWFSRSVSSCLFLSN